MGTQTLVDPSLDWNYFNRFLLIGSEQGGYLTPVPDLRATPTPILDQCLAADGVRVVRLASNWLVSGRPYRPEPALFALAKAVTSGDARTRQEALELLPVSLRTSSQLFQLVAYLGAPSRWSRQLRTALGAWYTQGTAVELVNQVLRSPREAAWNHRDLLGLVYTQPPTRAHQEVFHWIAHRTLAGAGQEDPAVELIAAYELMQTTNSEAVVAALLRRWPHLREDVPDRWLKSSTVWRQILPTLSCDALVRWLPRLAAADLLHTDGPVTASILQRLRLGGLGRTSRAPINALKALGAVRHAGKRLNRPPAEALEAALHELFHDRLRSTAPSAGTLVIAIDPAASTAPDGVSELPGLSPRLAFAALTLMAAASAREPHVLAFGKALTPIALAPDETLESFSAKLDAVEAGYPDGAAPIGWALEHGVSAEAFVVLSGNPPHPSVGHPEAPFARYCDHRGQRASWLAISTGPDRLCPEPPTDLNMMEAHGLDAAIPALVLDLIGETP